MIECDFDVSDACDEISPKQQYWYLMGGSRMIFAQSTFVVKIRRVV